MDAAALSLNIDSSSVVKATGDLERFSAAAAKAGASSGSNAGSIAKLVATVQAMDSKLASIVSSLQKMAAANDNAAASAQRVATANDNVGRALGAADSHVIAYTQHLAGLARAQQDANAHVIAYQQQIRTQNSVQGDANAHVLAYRESLNKVSDGAKTASESLKFTAREGLNASRQLADIGVTAAMGMSPFLIAIQQGPQLFDILQEKALVTGTSIGAVFKSAAASVAAMLAPLLPLIAILGIAAAAIAALTAQANNDSGLKKYTTAMGYTKAEVEKLNAVTVTFGDTMQAVFQVGFERIAGALGISAANMKKTWQSLVSFLITATREVVAGIYASFTGLGYAVKRVYDNIKAGRAESPLTTLVEGAKAARADAMGFMDDVVKRARLNARARQDAMAKSFYDAPKGGGASAPKTDRVGDILRDAQAEVAAENARAAAIGLSARAAGELEQRTKLLNQIEKAKIPVTDALRAKVDGLAKAYADAKIAADTAAAVEGVVDGFKRQNDAINDELSLVGSYGDALTRARIEMEALAKARDALPKGETLSLADTARVLDAAKPVANDQINLEQAKRMEKVRKDAEDAMYALDLERKGLGLTGAAAESYAYAAERLNQAKRDGITLGPEELAQINAAADAYGKARYAIDQQAKAIGDAREVTKGFFADWINGVREGGDIFKTFADSVLNSLNRIIDKLLDRTLEGFLDSMFKNGSGNFLSNLLGGKSSGLVADPAGRDLNKIGTTPTVVFPNALGGIYGAAEKFAKGGAFTNQVVNTPTLFRFAKGAALGEMGEAGPEAIVPLKRGPNGALGVQMHGGGRGRTGDVNVENHYHVSGAIDQGQIVAMIRQGGVATYDQVKRDLQSLLQQLDTDGAFAS